MNHGRLANAALVALCGAAYLPFIGGGLLTDDFIHFSRLRTAPTLVQILATPDPFRFYRPVVQSSFWLNSQLFGLAPGSFRAINLLLHLAVIASVFVLARKLLVQRGRRCWPRSRLPSRRKRIPSASCGSQAATIC